MLSDPTPSLQIIPSMGAKQGCYVILINYANTGVFMEKLKLWSSEEAAATFHWVCNIKGTFIWSEPQWVVRSINSMENNLQVLTATPALSLVFVYFESYRSVCDRFSQSVVFAVMSMERYGTAEATDWLQAAVTRRPEVKTGNTARGSMLNGGEYIFFMLFHAVGVSIFFNWTIKGVLSAHLTPPPH